MEGTAQPRVAGEVSGRRSPTVGGRGSQLQEVGLYLVSGGLSSVELK